MAITPIDIFEQTMDIKTLEDGSVVISTPNSLSPKFSPTHYSQGYCSCVIRIHKCVTHKPTFNFFVPFLCEYFMNF